MDYIKDLIGGPSDSKIGWIIILIASIRTSLEFCFIVFKYLFNKLTNQERKDLLIKISSLDTGLHISYFVSLIGNYISINKIDAIYQEYIFVNKYFYIQAITNLDQKVILFSVTTREKGFCPILKTQFNDFIVKLCETNFYTYNNMESSISLYDHGEISFYSEIYYFGYDGKYRTYLFSFNPYGYGELYFVNSGNVDNPIINIDRKKTFINTYTVCSFQGPGGHNEFEKKFSNIMMGPNSIVTAFQKK